jgi:hypothetical protein
VHGDLGKTGVADYPYHRSIRVGGILPTVDCTLGEQRAALVDNVRSLGNDHDELAAEGVDLQRDLAAGEDNLGEVDDQRAKARGQPGVPRGDPAPGPDHLAEAGGDSGPGRRPEAGVRWKRDTSRYFRMGTPADLRD